MQPCAAGRSSTQETQSGRDDEVCHSFPVAPQGLTLRLLERIYVVLYRPQVLMPRAGLNGSALLDNSSPSGKRCCSQVTHVSLTGSRPLSLEGVIFSPVNILSTQSSWD